MSCVYVEQRKRGKKKKELIMGMHHFFVVLHFIIKQIHRCNKIKVLLIKIKVIKALIN